MTAYTFINRLTLGAIFTTFIFALGSKAGAEVICDFKNQHEIRNSSSPNAFPGRAGEGWEGPWKVRRYLPEGSPHKRQQNSLEGISVVDSENADGSKWLRVESVEQFEDAGVGIHRLYENYGDLDLDKPYQISFLIRLDKLPSPDPTELLNNFLFIGENSTGSVGPTSGTTWFLQTFYGADTGKSVTPRNPEHRLSQARQRQWNLGTFATKTDANGYAATDVTLKEGVEYTISVSIYPEASSYRAKIEGGGISYTSDLIPFREGRSPNRSLVIGSRHSPGNAAIFSISNIRISESPSVK